MQKENIVGLDVSEKSIDVFLINDGHFLKVENSIKGMTQIVKWVKKIGIDATRTWWVFEYTGMYSMPLVAFCHTKGINFTQLPGLFLKRSMGVVRGKSDKVDAKKIAQFAKEKKEILSFSKAPSKSIQRLKVLLNLRERLVKQRAGYVASYKQMKSFLDLKLSDIIIQAQLSQIKSLKKAIDNIEQEIKEIVLNDDDINRNYKLLTSLKGVGLIVALSVLTSTENFSRFDNARQFACYCGTAPFEYQSGTSIRGKTRVHPIANKRIKCLLNQAAKCAIRTDPELKTYFIKRTEEGKNKMSTLNIIRNKLLGRMFAVIKRQTPYKIYQSIAA